jgi:diguanylate cyclase (GGDEF)-like protein
VFTFLIVPPPNAELVAEAVEAGVDDFLARPIVYGELLARLRAAARVLEFERRLREQADVDPLTGLAKRPPPQAGPNGACVVADLDQLRRINELYGRRSGDAVICAAADRLRGLCTHADALCSLGGGRFAVWMAGKTEAEAAAWAESARSALATAEIPLADGMVRLTASFGVAGADRPAATAEAVLEQAVRAVQTAKSSGRDCVVRSGEPDGDAAAWAALASPGKLFERTRAGDVMTPCTVRLRPEQPLGEAAALVGPVPPAAVPVVDDGGKLTGLVFPESLAGAAGGRGRESPRVADVMTADVPRFEEDATFAALHDFFTRDPRPVAVVTRRGKPTGLVTPDSLASLSHPLAADTFAPGLPFSDKSEYLVVPDLRLLGEG